MRAPGTVYLVGAGPGDPRLITLRGAEVLRTADVVVHDRLAAEALLDLAPASAERVYAGKHPAGAAMSQDAINAFIVSRAVEGLDVVRLKGGDPFVFGRGGEEALACARARVPFEVVPGVTSAVAAAAYAGVPLTHRGLATSFAVVTASTDGDHREQLRRAAAAADTVVILMAATKLHETCRLMIDAGRSPEEPAIIVEAATTSEQRQIAATLGTLAAQASRADIATPATVVVGAVAGLASELAWFSPASSSGGTTGR